MNPSRSALCDLHQVAGGAYPHRLNANDQEAKDGRVL
jgi:hypothetical protein